MRYVKLLHSFWGSLTLRGCLPVVVFSLLLSGQTLFAQAAFSGPAFGSITGGAVVSTELLKNSPELIEPLGKKVHNPFWEKYNPDLVDDRLDNTLPSAPLNSNEVFSNLGGTTSQPPTVLASFEGIQDRGSNIPPDPIMAVGPDHIIACVNTEFIIYDKRGNQLFRRGADAWYSNVLPNSGAFDPVVFYDHFEDRWVMLWDNFNDTNNTAFYLISVSDDSNPLGNWCNFAFPAHLNGTQNAFNWGDYPKMGYDQQAVYVSGRMFSLTGGGFNYCKVRIIPKAQLYANNCGPVDYTDFWNFRDPANTTVIVDGPPIAATHLDSSSTTYLIVDSPYVSSNFVTLWKLTDPLGSNPVLTGANVSTTASLRPPDGAQLGGTERIDNGRRAYRNAVYQNGHLWSAAPVAGGTGNQYSFARYVKIDVNFNQAVEDVALGDDGYYAMYPAGMVDEDDNFIMVYTRSGDNEYAAAAFTGRRTSDFPGLAPTAILKEGEAYYFKTFSGTRNRWGDYMGIHIDPKFPNIVWALVEYAESPQNTWGNWIGGFSYSIYGMDGQVTSAANNDPIEFADITLAESGQGVVSSGDGSFMLISPIINPTLNVTAFAFKGQQVTPALSLNDTVAVNISLQPEDEAVVSGQVRDGGTGTGIPAELEFWAEGNPFPGPYKTVSTDANGNYSVPTIIGAYEVRVSAVLPYPTLTVLDSFTLELSGLSLNVDLAVSDFFLVDDDEGSTYENLFISALDDAGLTYHSWTIQNDGLPGLSEFNQFAGNPVCWFTGDGVNTLSSDEQTALLELLNNNGRLLLTGQNIAEQTTGSALLTKLGVAFGQNFALPIVAGVPGQFTEGLQFSTLGGDGAGNQNSRDLLTISNTATTGSIFTYGTTASSIAGVSYAEGNSKAVFLGFGFEGINNAAARQQIAGLLHSFLVSPIDAVEPLPQSGIPQAFALEQNYPNPFNPETTINFSVPVTEKVRITIYNTLGQRVSELANQTFQPGNYRVTWDGRNDNGLNVPSGVYYYHLNAASGFQKSMKMLLVK